MQKPAFFRMKEGGGACTPSSPSHSYVPHQAVPVCDVCGYVLREHPYWEEEIAMVRLELLAMTVI